VFWDKPLLASDLEEYPGWVLRRVLMFGNRSQVARALEKEGLVDGWMLAGGTSLALQFGHRYSEGLDFFRTEAFETDHLAAALSRIGKVDVQSRSSGTLHVSLDGMRLSYLRAQAPFLFPGAPYRGLRLADPRDIAVMKVVAIGGRGSRKDFVDLYFYLRGTGGLAGVMSLLKRRFSGIDYNEYHLLKSLVYFDDAESEPMPRMIEKAPWTTIKKAIIAAVQAAS